MPDVSFRYGIFYVEDVEATLTFFTQAFGLSRKMLDPTGDYGELETGETVLAFASNSFAAKNLAAGGGFTPHDPDIKPAGAEIGLVTPDVHAAIETAIAAGATLFVDPERKPWGQMVGYVRDPSGILIELATPMG